MLEVLKGARLRAAQWYRNQGRRVVLIFGAILGVIVTTVLYPALEAIFTQIGFVGAVADVVRKTVGIAAYLTRQWPFLVFLGAVGGFTANNVMRSIRDGIGSEKIVSLIDMSEALNISVVSGLPDLPWIHLPQEIESNWELNEAIEQLRSALQIKIGSAPFCLMVTGLMPNSGKSTTARMLAASFARQGLKTLLINADLRMGDSRRTPVRGLSEMLAGGGAPNIEISKPYDILPAGKIGSEPGALLGGFDKSAALYTLKSLYDAIIVDTAPLGMSGTLEVARYCGNVLFACRQGDTHLDFASEIIARLRLVSEIELIGVLTRMKSRHFGPRYTYGYISDDDELSVSRHSLETPSSQ